jgi:hypothetical protein
MFIGLQFGACLNYENTFRSQHTHEVDRCDNSFSILKGLKKKKSARAER